MRYNEFEQPIGEPVAAFTPGVYPNQIKLVGTYCTLEKLSADKHFTDLYEVYGPESSLKNWTYLPLDPAPNMREFQALLQNMEESSDPYHFAIIDKQTNEALGTLALMRIDSVNRSVEVGFVIYSDRLKRTRIATEAQYLLASYVFDDLNYRRYEWKCDSLNAPSRNAALRLGFSYEGTFRNAVVYKDRNRDTAWFSMLDSEWTEKKVRLTNWLAKENFDEEGHQLRSLNE